MCVNYKAGEIFYMLAASLQGRKLVRPLASLPVGAGPLRVAREEYWAKDLSARQAPPQRSAAIPHSKGPQLSPSQNHSLRRQNVPSSRKYVRGPGESMRLLVPISQRSRSQVTRGHTGPHPSTHFHDHGTGRCGPRGLAGWLHRSLRWPG
jgi:hypothetical protein